MSTPLRKISTPNAPPNSNAADLVETYGSDVLKRLHQVTLFTDIRDQRGAIEALASIMGSREIKANEDIIREGTNGTEMFILMNGRALVFKSTPHGDEYKVAIFEGDNNVAFGESGLIDADSRSATIRAEIECVCLVLERTAFEKYSTAYPQWALPIYRRIAQAVVARMKKTNDDMLLLYNALVEEIRST